ncbi:MAG: YihY/virulence factor BrkB family protein [Paracoccaceae bacterium]
MDDARPPQPESMWRILRRTAVSAGRHRLSLIAAGVAFFATLALFPAIATVVALYGVIADPHQVEFHLSLLRPVAPPAAFSLIEAQVSQLVAAGPVSLKFASVVSSLIAFWAARAGIAAMVSGIDLVHSGSESRSLPVDLLIGLALTLLMIVVTLVAVTLVVVAPAFLVWMPPGNAAALALQALRWAIGLASVLLALGALYRFAPHRPRRRRIAWVTTGSVLAAALWVAASAAFSFYLSNFGDYNEIYGSLGAVAALLMWFYISAYLALLGAELNEAIGKAG